MERYRVVMDFWLEPGMTEDRFWNRFYGSTKHSGLTWHIEGFEPTGELEDEDY